VVSGSLTSPAIELRQLAVRRHGAEGCWIIAWTVENTGAESLDLESVRLPHGAFKSAEQPFEPALKLAPAAVAEFQTQVFCRQPTGSVTENAFLIFKVSWLSEDWRVFVRVRVVVNQQGEPQAVSESVTTQKVGFSGVPN
jgi:hypothetical protein